MQQNNQLWIKNRMLIINLLLMKRCFKMCYYYIMYLVVITYLLRITWFLSFLITPNTQYPYSIIYCTYPLFCFIVLYQSILRSVKSTIDLNGQTPCHTIYWRFSPIHNPISKVNLKTTIPLYYWYWVLEHIHLTN